MKKHRRISRRSFAAGLGVAAVTAPFWNILKTRAQATFPKRFVVWFTPNGTITDSWGADGTETNFTLRPILSPLEPFKDKLIVLDGVDMESASHGPGDGHQMGMGHWLTGTELLPGDDNGGCDTCEGASWAGGPSIDQVIANAIARSGQRRSLELGVQCGGSENVWSRMCYRAAGEPLPPTEDPFQAFDLLFGNLVEDPFGAERRRALQQSVLAFVKDDFQALRSRLGREDAQRLEQHLEGINEVEQRLAGMTGVGASCTAPAIGGRIDIDADDNYPAVGRAQMDNLVMALACDLTRVASLQWSRSVGGVRSPWLDIAEGHHELSHEDEGATQRDKLIRINRWYSEQLAYMLDKMSQIPEGDGTLLDNTIVLVGNELGRGGSHTRRNMPFLLAGSGGGAIRTGRYLSLDDSWHNDLHSALCRAFGMNVTTFGNPEYCKGSVTLT